MYVKDFTKRIVRIGGRCQEEELEGFNFKDQLRREPRMSGFWHLNNNLKSVEQLINKGKFALFKFQFGIITTFIFENPFAEMIIKNLMKNFNHHMHLYLTAAQKNDILYMEYVNETLKKIRDSSK
jgi:AAA+ ATPase superfamily predicted ATPase